MKYRIEVETRLVFAAPVREHHCELRLAPRVSEQQKLAAAEVVSEPRSDGHSYADCFGNRVDCLDVTPPHEALVVRLGAEVDTLLANPFDYRPVHASGERSWLDQALGREPRLLDYVLHHGELVPGGAAAAELFAGAPRWEAKEPLIDAVSAARDWVAERVSIAAVEEGPLRPLVAVMESRSGNGCDRAHAMVALVRSWGVPARYVNGYEDVAGEDDEERGPERQALHAWAEVLIPGAGWRGFDPTFGLVVNDHYVAVAVGRDAGDVPPFKQVFKGEGAGEQELKLQVSRHDQ